MCKCCGSIDKTGLLIIISGSSGVGKCTIINKIMEKKDDLKLSVSFTTRKPRDGEINGKDYHFVSKKEFEYLAEEGKMLECTEYCDNFYGTAKNEVFYELEKGNDVILEIDVKGAIQAVKHYQKTVTIFIIPPSFEDLRSRLLNRGIDNTKTINKRVEESKKELYYAANYDYIVLNDNVNDCVDIIIDIIEKEQIHKVMKEIYEKTKRRI